VEPRRYRAARKIGTAAVAAIPALTTMQDEEVHFYVVKQALNEIKGF
jgi:hypothetical protein